MKKVFISLMAAVFALSSCSVPTRLVNTATYKTVSVATPVAAVFADLDVSPQKITYFMMPSKSVVSSGYDNVVNSAVREALLANGNADVLVGLETQVKYGGDGMIESITVTGYPARYVNFRSPGDEYLKAMQGQTSSPAPTGVLPAGGFLGKLKSGK